MFISVEHILLGKYQVDTIIKVNIFIAYVCSSE